MVAKKIRYELGKLETLTRRSTCETTAAIVAQVSREVERIRRAFVGEVFSFEDERHLRRYIQYHQRSVIRLMDYVSAGSRDSNYPLYTMLDNLLLFMERQFANYFDQDAIAPQKYLALARQDIAVNLQSIYRMLADAGISDRALMIVLFPLRMILKAYVRDVTYRQITYARNLQRELLALITSPLPGNVEDELRSIMFYLNYNDDEAVEYHKDYIYNAVSATTDRTEKIEKLSWFYKQVSQAQVRADTYFDALAEPLREQLIRYITAELEYLDRISKTFSSSGIIDNHLFRLQLSVSVAQLAYLIRIFTETRLVQNENLAELIRFIARSAVTRRSENISIDSFKNKFYNVEHSTRIAVRSLLTDMVQHIDRSG